MSEDKNRKQRPARIAWQSISCHNDDHKKATLTSAWRNHPIHSRHDHVEQYNELRVVLCPDAEPSDLGQAFERHIAEIRHLEEL